MRTLQYRLLGVCATVLLSTLVEKDSYNSVVVEQ